MSEAVAELPEAPPGPQKDADELLSQLAGKEVDRLLASAEIEREEGPASVARVNGTRAISLPAGTLAADAANAHDDDEAVLAQQIEALIDGDKDKKNKATTEPEAAPAAAAAVDIPANNESPAAAVASAAIAQPPAPAESVAPLESRLAEDSQTAAAPPDVATKVADATPASESQAESINVDSLEVSGDSDRRLPIFLLPLDWFNRPFAFLSEAARDAMGKIAVVTSLNAAALFVYVIWFRHH